MLNKKQIDRAKGTVKMIFKASNVNNARCHIRALFQSKKIDIMESSLLHEYLDSLTGKGESVRAIVVNENKKRILRKFWHDFSNDLYRLNSDQFEGMGRYFKGYSNGLEQANVITIDEHVKITDKITEKIDQETDLRESRLKRALQG